MYCGVQLKRNNVASDSALERDIVAIDWCGGQEYRFNYFCSAMDPAFGGFWCLFSLCHFEETIRSVNVR